MLHKLSASVFFKLLFPTRRTAKVCFYPRDQTLTYLRLTSSYYIPCRPRKEKTIVKTWVRAQVRLNLMASQRYSIFQPEKSTRRLNARSPHAQESLQRAVVGRVAAGHRAAVDVQRQRIASEKKVRSLAGKTPRLEAGQVRFRSPPAEPGTDFRIRQQQQQRQFGRESSPSSADLETETEAAEGLR